MPNFSALYYLVYFCFMVEREEGISEGRFWNADSEEEREKEMETGYIKQTLTE